MNENLYVNSHGLRLIQEFEGAPRLKARLCEGNSWELSYGVTFDLNGNPFTADSTCTPEYSDTLFRNALQNVFEPGVRNLVTVPLNSNQFSGLTALAWNIGIANFATSSVLRRVNENRMDDAAACFGMWIFATDGSGHKQAMRGLLRRRFAESCLFMGYDWTVACDNDAIALQREIPETFPGTDRVIYKTPFKDVLSVAQRYPLAPADELVLNTPAPPLAKTGSTAVVGGVPIVPPVQVGTSPTISPAPPVPPVAARKPEAVPAPPQPPRAPVPPPPKPVIIAPERINPNQLPTNADTSKNMADSTRMVGMVLVAIGSVIQVVTLRLGIGTAIGAVFFDLTRDPVVITLAVTAVVAALGWVTKRNGKKTFAKGADQAQGNLY